MPHISLSTNVGHIRFKLVIYVIVKLAGREGLEPPTQMTLKSQIALPIELPARVLEAGEGFDTPNLSFNL